MLRIIIDNGETATRLIVEGKLAGEWVSELEQCWLAAAAAEPRRPLKIEFTDVSFIDEAGRELLARMAANGAELKAFDLAIKAIVEEVLEPLMEGDAKRH